MLSGALGVPLLPPNLISQAKVVSVRRSRSLSATTTRGQDKRLSFLRLLLHHTARMFMPAT